MGMRHWNRLPREALDVPSMEMFKARLDGALSNLVEWKESLPKVEGVWSGITVQSKPFYYSSMITNDRTAKAHHLSEINWRSLLLNHHK